jgi:hypothetical protein
MFSPGSGKAEINTLFRLADAAGLMLKPYSAKDTFIFSEKHFVQENGHQHIIKWMDIFHHTRNPGIGIYECWCNSFSPLIWSFLRITQNDDLNALGQHWVNRCVMAQVTDFEQAILD